MFKPGVGRLSVRAQGCQYLNCQWCVLRFLSLSCRRKLSSKDDMEETQLLKISLDWSHTFQGRSVMIRIIKQRETEIREK